MAEPLHNPAIISPLDQSIDKATNFFLKAQHPDGYWWFTLEANETIGSGFIQLMHFLGEVDTETQSGLIRRMLSQQREDGSWALFYGGPGDISITVECYLALRLAGHSPEEAPLQKAKKFILAQGGLTQIRVFSRIHLAMFGLVPWSTCPSMPIWLMLLPPSSGFSIYEFSSWARASIVPLLLLDSAKPVHAVPFDLNELYVDGKTHFSFPEAKESFSLKNFFVKFDKVLKLLEKLPWHPGRAQAIQKAVDWTREHVARTEDIYPAMAYAALGFKAIGFPNNDPTIQKALKGLKNFQQKLSDGAIHQQCCISPNWDTPWAGMALLESGTSPKNPKILKTAQYLISKEVKNFRGDWKIKNPEGPAAGWSFEFENDYFPDVDDTIEALLFLKQTGVPQEVIDRNLAWLLSMQSQNGGWAAFDKDNTADWVNQIPFSDHGACLDPPTPDITGRMIELLSALDFPLTHEAVLKALAFLEETQEPCGAWRGRWGVNYIYGTWCVLQGLASLSPPSFSLRRRMQKAAGWLQSIQNADGGWGESCLSDTENQYVPLKASTASQTAWAVMGLIAAGERNSLTVRRGVEWLLKNQNAEGGWDEEHFTGTGFPGHFYIRYHGYRNYFPLLALGKYNKKI